MEFQKFSWLKNLNVKEVIFKALSEIVLIVGSILIALFINNYNSDYQYEKQVNESFLSIYDEIGKNTKEAKLQIGNLQKKDSLIYLVMNDSVGQKDYENNYQLSYLIIFFHSLELQDKAYENLVKLNISSNNYNNELMSDLKYLYAIGNNIKETDARISEFVYDKSIPFLSENVESFSDLTYKGIAKKDAIDFFLRSSMYKSYVSQYSIIAIKNQLEAYQIYYKKAISIYKKIGKQYKLAENESIKLDKRGWSTIIGGYYNAESKDTLKIEALHDSLFIKLSQGAKYNLINISNNNYYMDVEDRGGAFISFNKSKNDSLAIKIQLQSAKLNYLKIAD